VDEALSGAEMLDLIKKKKYHIIFLDHMMPEMDGVEAMKLLKQAARAKNRETRFVALTANAVSGAREMFHAEGFDGFIPKPIETGELERVLCRILPISKVRITQGESREGSSHDSRGYYGDELGVERCFGDRDLFNRLRRIFVEEMPHNLRVFRSAYATGTMEPYSVRLRSLRDGARIIGEEELVRRARRLEQAIADSDTIRVQKGHADLCTYYEECVQAIRERLEKEGYFV
jgi:CheY-like chemotaxis protein